MAINSIQETQLEYIDAKLLQHLMLDTQIATNYADHIEPILALHGNNNSHFIIGGPGNDCLYGGNGDDFLIGNGGQDILEGGKNHGFFISDPAGFIYTFRGDHLWGGRAEIFSDGGNNFTFINHPDHNQNTFIFRNGDSVQTIHDYQIGIDRPIEIHGYDESSVQLIHQGPHTFVQLSDSEGILCLNKLLHGSSIYLVSPNIILNTCPEPVLELTNAAHQSLHITGKIVVNEFDSGDPMANNELTIAVISDPVVLLDGEPLANDPLMEHNDLIQALTDPNALSFNAHPYNSNNLQVKYDYHVKKLNLDFLPEGAELTIHYQVQAFNQCAHSEILDLVFTVIGTNDIPIITGTDTGFVKENNAADALTQVSGKLIINDLDEGENFFQLPVNPFDSANEWTYTLKTVTPFDTDSTFFQNKNSSIFKENTMPNILLGDGPTDATLVGTYGTCNFTVTGEWTYTLDNSSGSATDQLAEGQVVHDTFTLTSFDGTTTHTINITVTGTNDLPVISGDVTGSITASDGTIVPNVTAGQVLIADADAGQSSFVLVGNLVVNYGIFSVDTNTGAWTYTVNDSVGSAVYHLGEGATLTDTLELASFDGSTPVNVTVTIVGINDVPVIGGDNTGTVIENNNPDVVVSTSGSLTISDGDTGESSFQIPENLVGTYGSFTLDTAGNWTYTLDDSAGSLADALQEGETVHDTLTVTSFDGTASTTLDVTVIGVNDVPDIGGDNLGLVKEDTAPDTVFGALTIADADHDQSSFQVPEDLTGAYGSFSFDSTGNWSYTLDNSAGSATDQLAEGQEEHDYLLVTSADGSANSVIDITVLGTNDLPVITGDDAGAVTEDNTPGAVTTVSGVLTIVDADAGQSSFQLPTLMLEDVLSDQGHSSNSFHFHHLSCVMEHHGIDHFATLGLDTPAAVASF